MILLWEGTKRLEEAIRESETHRSHAKATDKGPETGPQSLKDGITQKNGLCSGRSIQNGAPAPSLFLSPHRQVSGYMWGLFWLPDRADTSNQTCSAALSTSAQNRSCEHQSGAGTYRQISGKHFPGTMKLPEFTHSHLVAFDAANEYDFKSHNFQEFMNFRVIVLCSSFPRQKSEIRGIVV